MLRRVLSRLSLTARPRLASGLWSFVPQPEKRGFSSDVGDREETQKKIETLVQSNRVVLFMKGSPESPQCGFSRAVVKLLAAEEVEDYVFADVLKSPALREGVKQFSDWPTIPQLFVDGQFVGGCDIAVEMHKSGELKRLLAKQPQW